MFKRVTSINSDAVELSIFTKKKRKGSVTSIPEHFPKNYLDLKIKAAYKISTADDKSIRIWDLSGGRCYRKIYNAHDHFISCFDMKGKMAATVELIKNIT